ncbi:hypothetical protein FH972_020202 [Carpinus fangiana]|uniref:Uncharacterized protein n=1 Tax=Carpinus fangiana TaxID=176857 RepID=A0A5N6RUN7_9ROSI|nr:hypothetical protein FH972_020202 [Carpinus fangiana]
MNLQFTFCQLQNERKRHETRTRARQEPEKGLAGNVVEEALAGLGGVAGGVGGRNGGPAEDDHGEEEEGGGEEEGPEVGQDGEEAWYEDNYEEDDKESEDEEDVEPVVEELFWDLHGFRPWNLDDGGFCKGKGGIVGRAVRLVCLSVCAEIL